MEPQQRHPPAQERVLACTSPAAVSDRLVEIGRRLATGRNAVLTRPDWMQYLPGLVLVSLLTVAGFWVRRFIGSTNLAMLYLLTVVVSALRWGRGPAILTAVSSALFFDFFFVPPRLSFAATDTEYILTLIGLLVVGVVISTLAAQVQERAAAAREREAHTAALYSLSRSLATARHLDQILEAVALRIKETFDRPALVFLPQDRELRRCFGGPESAPPASSDAAAEWVYEHGRPAGPGTEMFSDAGALYLPLRTSGGMLGVLALEAYDPKKWLDPERRRLLDAFVSQAALAIERMLLEEAAQQTQLLQETDKLQKALLNSISHNLRTPLASITGALSSLSEDTAVLDEAAQRELLDTAREESARLNRLVGNLLDMTRLEAGAMRLKREPCDVQDVIGAALAQLGEAARKRPITTRIPAGLPLAPMDFVLIAQVLVNLVDNALKYSPPDSPITIEARATGGQIEIAVADRGAGIAPADLERVFEKFSRVGRAGAADGTGLGLSICKGFVEAHGGRIWIEPRPGGGTMLLFVLPLYAPEAASNETSYERARAASAGG